MRRSPNTISRELLCNHVRGSYDPKKAQHKAYVRRTYAKYQGMKIIGHATLRKEVMARLYDDQSPEAIAGYIKRNRTFPSLSKNSIYRFIASIYGRRIENHRNRRHARRRGRQPYIASLPKRTFIDKRPRNITARKHIGDAEADFIVSGTSGKGILLVVVDRKSRMTFIEQIMCVTVHHVHAAFLHINKRFPELKSLTMDNDILFAKHKEIAVLLRVKIYFCHPYHSWEKGTVENVNKVIRRDIPKGSDISRYTRRFIEALEHKLNRRPMKCLMYRSPQEVLETHRRRKQKTRSKRGVLIEGVG